VVTDAELGRITGHGHLGIVGVQRCEWDTRCMTESITVGGVADNGAHVTVTVPASWAESMDPDHALSWWPPVGLAPVDVPSKPTQTFTAVEDSVTAMARLESDLGLFTAEHLADRVAVHAAVLSINGAVILLPGKSMAGKSSLCVAAHRLGHQVHSDEYALVDPGTGLVVGWSRPVRQRNGDGTVQRLPLHSVMAAAPVTLVAGLAYDASDPVWRVEELSPAEIATLLLMNTVCGESRPEFAFRGALAVARKSHGIQGVRGEAEEALGELASICSRVFGP
jgi:hypothetical protein